MGWILYSFGVSLLAIAVGILSNDVAPMLVVLGMGLVLATLFITMQ